MLKDLVEEMAEALVDRPDQVSVAEIWTNNVLVFELEVAHSDIGKVIGKKGRNADAMQTILATAADSSRTSCSASWAGRSVQPAQTASTASRTLPPRDAA